MRHDEAEAGVPLVKVEHVPVLFVPSAAAQVFAQVAYAALDGLGVGSGESGVAANR